MHILVAPNAFKHSIDAATAAAAISEGLQQSTLHCTLHCFPAGDGGDGTGALILRHCKGSVVTASVHDPLGRNISSSFGLIDNGKTAVIEMAAASGLRLLQQDELNPLRASSSGTGELMRQAIDVGANKIILCIGGSATVDGGTGILQALGYRFLDKKGKTLSNLPESLASLHSIDDAAIDKRIHQCKVVILCDVENNLLGHEGAAAVFGPQKGATPEAVAKLEASLANLRDVILKQTGKDISTLRHGGAAGGVAAGLAGMINAQLVNGIDYFLSLTGFDDALAKADLVITGEGSIDIQTLQGKGPFGIAKRAKEKGIRVVGMAGKIPFDIPAEMTTYFDILLSINSGPVDLAEALRNTRINLTKTARELGDRLQKGQS